MFLARLFLCNIELDLCAKVELLDPNSWANLIDCIFEQNDEVAKRLGLKDSCDIQVVQPLGGFIGSDLLAGLISEKVQHTRQTAILIDFGTNSEIALWTNGHFLVTSAAGGPAFEGGGISCGMHAMPGAIYKIEKNELGEFVFDTIGEQQPTGLCGSALVDALAIFVKDGLIAKNGRIKNGKDSLTIGKSGFYINSSDIDALQRAKSAIRAGIDTLCDIAALSADEIQKYYICGAFGEYIDSEHAQDIGLLPKISNAEIKICGNTALNGAQDMLVSDEAIRQSEHIRKNLTVVNLAGSSFFEDSFFKNLFF
jgi:uncharacterized 2Fe-2S/4Fe-4S cluster protein (DUF4445 family)